MCGKVGRCRRAILSCLEGLCIMSVVGKGMVEVVMVGVGVCFCNKCSCSCMVE